MFVLVAGMGVLGVFALVLGMIVLIYDEWRNGR